ncbi:hypothetical protein [Dysosmobacter sp.]|uniref:hypothetical protein n=1 Tax=Dysosmobacter sp. TaxID=2591382 RepID=UPI002A87261C|nr:hypothetical protein [Dysosmobacter sp.]MDY3282245.1 hypothetical protein [Dysosmobacter sp.]
MTKQERLFRAIGGADEELLERSEQRRRRRWPAGLAAAACLLLMVGVCLLAAPAGSAPPEESGGAAPASPGASSAAPESPAAPAYTLRLSGGGVGSFHLHQLSAGTAADFILYVDETAYRQSTEGGVLTVEPLVDMGDLPACRLEVSRQPDISLEDAGVWAAERLSETYGDVSEPEAAGPGALTITASGGLNWDSPQALVRLVEDRQGGVFVLYAQCFLEAAEGHGARFADMMATFEPVSPEDGAPAWLTSLREVGSRLVPAFFSGDLTAVSDLLAPGAAMDLPDLRGRSVSALDYTVDDDRSPTRAVLSVRNRELEDSYDYLTVELACEDGQWLVVFAGLEK